MSQQKLVVFILSLSLMSWPLMAVAKSFTHLSDALSFYAELENSDQWSKIPKGPSVRLNDTHPSIPLLRQKLQLLGDLELTNDTPENPELFDQVLVQALTNFQSRHGAEADGVLGPHTRRLLNTSPAYRIKQLQINASRQQSFGTPTAQHYIRVNIPEFKLRLYDQEQVTLEMKTVVGRKKRQTPVFDTTIRTLVINPSWNVPKSIAFKDILPKWEQDDNFLNSHNLQIRSGWGPNSDVIPAENVVPSSMYQGAEYLRFFEPPSKRNTLGQFKFLSQSRYAIYLHDTPAKHLFNRTRRDYSSGCVRLERAQDLASALLSIANRPEKTRLKQLAKTDKTRNINFAEPVPLYVVYWTAWLDKEGTLHFRDDIYKRDLNDLAKLKSEENQISAIDQHIK
ncbi:MAG: L,D-transpeptidase family protein [Pseudomonadales bacterium]